MTDPTGFAIRGVIEGFYGQPWTHEQRLRAIRLLGPRGMNTYLVSTKDEPWQRADWSGPLPDSVVSRLAELSRAARESGMELGVSTSPGLTICYSDPGTVGAIVSRFEQLASVGIRTLGLFLDDIPGELQHSADLAAFADLTAAHEHLLASVAHAMPEGTQLLVISPTYWGLGTEDDVRRLGTAIPPGVHIMWTGRQICSAYLHSADARVLTESMQRPPLYWDNYPVNDVAMTHELHIGPFRGRDGDLDRWSAGLLANPMSLFEASLLPLLTVADYVRDPGAYDPEASWDMALAALFPVAADRDAYRTFARCHLDSCLNPSAAPELEEALSRAMFEWRTGDPTTATERLRAESERMRASLDRIDSDSFGNQDLRREVLPWVRKLRTVSESLDALADFISGSGSAQALRDVAHRLSQDPTRSAGDGPLMTVEEIVALEDARRR